MQVLGLLLNMLCNMVIFNIWYVSKCVDKRSVYFYIPPTCILQYKEILKFNPSEKISFHW